MNRIETEISWGHLALLEIFARANDLVLQFERIEMGDMHRGRIAILFEEGSDTELTLGFMGFRHLGVNNMLIDYLLRCNVDPYEIFGGAFVIRKSEKQMEEEWQEHRKKIGLSR